MATLALRGTTDPVADLHACVDAVSCLDPALLGSRDQAVLLTALARAEARIAAIRLRVLAAAEASNAAAASGLASTDQWAARALNADPVRVHREVQLSRRLISRIATQEALSTGRISTQHAVVIVAADQQLPAGVTAEQRGLVERALVAKAETMPPQLLRRAARRALAEIESDTRVVDAHEESIVGSEEERARERTRLTLHDNEDGTISGHFTVPVLHGQLLRKILQTMAAPRRGRPGASQAQIGPSRSYVDHDHVRGTAFCELLEHLPTDHLHPRTAATVVVSVSEEVLRGALAIAGLDTGAAISAGEARRLACGARIIPAVLGGASLPLDLGRASRLFSEAQRTALGLKHDSCAADGCNRPFAWCELHHHQAWASGGSTDVAQAVPLCHFHHQRIHDHHYEHHRDPSGDVVFHRRT